MATVGFDGPVPSLRLKWLRDSMDDYDYIALLKAHGEEAYALDQVRTLARGVDDWEMDPSLLYAARQQLGTRLAQINATAQVEETADAP